MMVNEIMLMVLVIIREVIMLIVMIKMVLEMMVIIKIILILKVMIKNFWKSILLKFPQLMVQIYNFLIQLDINNLC